MISEKTISVWTKEFAQLGRGPKGEELPATGTVVLEYLLKMQAQVMEGEPTFAALVSTIFNMLDMKDPVTAAFYALGLYFELEKRQKEADGLEAAMKG